MTNLADTYLACWNESDPAARTALVAEHWAPEATYTDPMADVAGRDAIVATIGAVQEQFPGFVFTRLGEVDAHHRQARFRWGLGPAGAEPVIEGADVVLTDDDGRFTTVLGFLDRVPVSA